MPHTPVLYAEALRALDIKPGGCYLDATFGRGGHCRGVLECLDETGRLLAMDKDPQAARVASRDWGRDSRLVFCRGNFASMDKFITDEGVYGGLDGVLMDLGVSSPQLDDPGRGFSFSHDGPLDMRMDTTQGITAGQWLNTADEVEIAGVLRTYGEERHARRIARAIVRYREKSEIATTLELAGIIRAAMPGRERGKNPATRSFQALRIQVNGELEALEAGLEQAVQALRPGGRLVVISFHSLEDRIVKRFMRRLSRPAPRPRRMPPDPEHFQAVLSVIGKPVRPRAAELAGNPRARSAVLRVAEKRP